MAFTSAASKQSPALSWTLSRYFAQQMLKGMGMVFAVCFILIALVDLVDMGRRTSGQDFATIGLIIEMSLMRITPYVEKFLPFATLFGAMWANYSLARHSELVVARAAGVSVWQVLAPAVVIAIGLGSFVIAVWNPVSAAMLNRYERLEAKYLENGADLMSVSDSGVWLRQANRNSTAVIHADESSQQGINLRKVSVYRYNRDDEFIERFEAAKAQLKADHWTLYDVMVVRVDEAPFFLPKLDLSTSLTPITIRDSFVSPEALSFWALPGFIKSLQSAGFSALRHRLHWHATLALPVMLVGMILIAAAFTLRFARHGNTGTFLLLGVLTGFGFYLAIDFALALGISGRLPPELAAWAPVGAALMLGVSLLIQIEDG
ncbi:MAG: LPS export ABC transporter permease LptG [Alphaproteobacteria bacterium]